MKEVAFSSCMAILAILSSCKTGIRAMQDRVSGQIINNLNKPDFFPDYNLT
jgi:hypothetical protein